MAEDEQEKETISRSKNKKKERIKEHNKRSIQEDNLSLLPQSDNQTLSLKQKIKRYTQYNLKPKPLTLFLCVLVLIGMVWAIDYLHNNLLNSHNNIPLSSKKSDRLQMTFVGDMMMARGNQRQANQQGYDHFFQKSKYLWQKSDLVVGNLESALITNKMKVRQNSDKDIHLLMKPEGVSAMKRAGFTTLGTANNHVGDYGKRGIQQELNYFKKNNIDSIGTGNYASNALKYQIYDINGVKVSLLAVTDIIPKHTSVKQTKPGALTTNNDDYLNLIKEASAHSDYTIVYSHWGFENGLTVTDRQKELGKKMIDAGADMVVGMHAHVLQPIDKYKNGLILNGMGNFVFEQEQSRTKDSVVANLRMTKNGQMKLELIPMRIKDGVPSVTRNPLYKRRIYHQLTKDLPQSSFQKHKDTIVVDNFGYNYQFTK